MSDGFFYAVRTESNEQFIKTSQVAMQKLIKELKTKLPTFRKFNTEFEAKQWLDNPAVTPQRPTQLSQKNQKLKMSGSCESPLRVARSPFQKRSKMFRAFILTLFLT